MAQAGFGKFSDISGQDAITAHLRNALSTGTLSHAYLISGEDVSDTMEIANALASVLVCEDRQEGYEPCGKCTGCVQAAAGDHPDIRVLVPQKTTSTGVDDIRALTADLQLVPYRASFRIFIIPDAEKLTPQAQNAVLKTLVEPPEYAVLLLLCRNTTGFLPTLLSRCVCLQLKPVPDEEIGKKIAAAAGAMPAYPELLYACAAGSCGKALRLITEEDFDGYAGAALELLMGLKEKDAGEIVRFCQDTAENGRAELFLFIMHAFIRDLLVQKAAGSGTNLILTGNIQYISKTAGELSFAVLGRMEKTAVTAQRRLMQKGSPQLILEAALLTLREEMNGEIYDRQ